jgi:hypothetical protein
MEDTPFFEIPTDAYWSWEDLDGKSVHVKVQKEHNNHTGEDITFVFFHDLETGTTYVRYGD